TGIGPQPCQRGVGVVDLFQPGAACDGDSCRLTKFARQRSNDEDSHRGYPARSVLTISVIVTPRRLSSTMTTSPRATRRLFTYISMASPNLRSNSTTAPRPS